MSRGYGAGGNCGKGICRIFRFSKSIFFDIIYLMKEYLKKLTNYSYGGTSAIITNISLVIGLGSTNVPKSGIIGGLLVIALADNISDSLGIHIYQESGSCGTRESFISTVLNFTTRLLVSASFIFIVLFFPIQEAQLISLLWGLLVLGVMSYFISKKSGLKTWLEIAKHIGVALIVIAASKYAADFIHSRFGKV